MAEQSLNELEAMRTALGALEDLDPEGRSRAIAWLAGALGVGGLGPLRPAAGPASGSAAGAAAIGDLGTPKQFLASKAPQTDVERVATLAYYLTHARETPHFKTQDLTDLNLEAAGPRLSNTSYAVSNAVKKNGYLAAGPGQTRQITARGEALVEALPDRSAAKAAVDAMPGKPRRVSGRTPTRRRRTTGGTEDDRGS